MSPARMSKYEAALRAVLAFKDAFNQHDLDALADLFDPACVFESPTPPPDGTTYRGKETITQFWQDYLGKTPNAQIKIEEIFGFGNDRCTARWKLSWGEGEHTEHLRGAGIFRVEKDLITEMLVYIKG